MSSISRAKADDIVSKIKYPSFPETRDCAEFYHICLKYLCRDFAKRHEIYKIGLMIIEHGGLEAMRSCHNKLETLVSKEMKKTDLTEKEQKEVVQHVNKTVCKIWKDIR